MTDLDKEIIIAITKSQQGYTLKKPIIVKSHEPKSKVEAACQKFVIETFTGKSPNLVKFCLESNSAMKVTQHFLLHSAASKATLYNCIYDTHYFTHWLGTTPDAIVSQCLDSKGAPNFAATTNTEQSLEHFLAHLKIKQFSPVTAYNMIKYIKIFFKINWVILRRPHTIKKWSRYQDRSPTQEELQRVLNIATLRERVIICCLATGGFRVGTLARLRYKHIRNDFEKRLVPIHVHVEAEITKTKYHDYDTFLNYETEKFLRSYFEERKKGYKEGSHFYLPENISDDSPLISSDRQPKPLTPEYISKLIHSLYLRVGMNERIGGVATRYEVRPHSTRKFFRSQLALLGMKTEFIEYMIGHKTSNYFDVAARGIDFLRGVYVKADLSIRPQTTEDKIAALESLANSWGIKISDISANLLQGDKL